MLSLLLTVAGAWLILDGAVSMWIYMNQSYAEQSIRVVRVVLGALILLLYGVGLGDT
jgi:hypothetical protein